MQKISFLNSIILPFLVLLLVLSGCAKSSIPIPPQNISTQGVARPEQTPDICPQRHTILQAALNAVGSPYHWGGTSLKQGFDCSGLVVFTHAKIGIHVPRTAKAQYKSKNPVLTTDILPADLVFFTIPGKNKNIHVGIYVGENQFVHAPGRGRKVMLASLENPYFQHHFIGAGNFLDIKKCR